MRRSSTVLLFVCLAALLGLAPRQQAVPASVEVEPPELALQVGETAQLAATVKDASGNVIESPVFYFSRARRSLAVDPQTGAVNAKRPGSFEIIAVAPTERNIRLGDLDDAVTARVQVTVQPPPVAAIKFKRAPSRYYAGTEVQLQPTAFDEHGDERPETTAAVSSDNPAVGAVDETGMLRLHRPGSATITARAGSISTAIKVSVEEDPVRSFELQADATEVRTGDVVRVLVVAKDAGGHVVPELPVRYGVSGRTDEQIIAAGATAQIEPDGRFVAERSGLYTVVAYAGEHAASLNVRVEPRNVQRRIELLGQGRVGDRHTSDLWVWEGVDGRDYAVTGTWGADGHAYFWDVTDPADIVKIAEVQVDARTVNDVKVSEDGRIAVVSREGASNRRNGLVILDVADPHNPEILSSFDDDLTGGVHNLFIYDNHVYALSAGRRYDVINIEDPSNPHRVGRFALNTPGASIHDVWIVRGIAYSSNWDNGVVAVDVGGGNAGGSPNNPVMLGKYAYPSGANHAAFPFRSKSTGKFYALAGDEIFPFGMQTRGGGKPTYARGWIHFIEWDDWDNPVEVARYQVPEAGTHNLWVDEENEILYLAMYNGGLRVVDISGDLLGDLYGQGREIAYYIPDDPDGFIANAPMAWGPQPHKGSIFFSDWNSGLWAVRLTDRPARSDAEPH